jgi:hypothetical protein
MQIADGQPRARFGIAAARQRRWIVRLADHHRRHVGPGELGDLAAADHFAAAEHRHLIGKSHHLFELMRDDDDRELA